jgi:hypothetical protein
MEDGPGFGDALGLLVGEWSEETPGISERAHAEEPKRSLGKGVAMSRDEPVRLRRP